MLRQPLTVIAAASTLILVGPAVAKPQCVDGGGGIWNARCKAPSAAQSTKKKEQAEPAPAATEVDANAAAGTTNAVDNGAALGAAVGASAAATASAGTVGALAGIATGQTVKTSGGTTVGKVSKIVKGSDGSVSQVIVTSDSGRSFPLAASKLSVSGGVVIATDESE